MKRLLATGTGLLSSAGIPIAWAVHWDGQRPLAGSRVGELAGGEAERPACLGGPGSCLGCNWPKARSAGLTVLPLRTGGTCQGALLLGEREFSAGEFSLLEELAGDLACTVSRLGQLEGFVKRDNLLRRMEELGELGGWELDPSSGDMEWTEGALRILDQPEQATPPTLGEWLQYYTPDSRARLRLALEGALQRALGFDVVLELTGAGGARKWIRTSGKAGLREGQVVRVVGSLQDLSPRVAIELKLQRSRRRLLEQQKRLGAIFKLMLAGILVVRLSDQTIVDVNPALERLLGWSAAEMQGQTLRDLEVFGRPEVLTELGRQFERSSLTPTEVRVRRKSGEEADFLITGGAAHLNGEDCVISIWHDVSELRSRDAALRESDRQVRAIFEMAPVGIALGDPRTGQILEANARYCQITGYSLEELQNMKVSQLTHWEDRALSGSSFQTALSGDIPEFHINKRYLRKDGQVAWVSVDVKLMRNAQGSLTHTIAVVEDVTQARQADEKLRETQQLLLSAQKMEAVGQLAGGIAHDFNNLLTVILSYTELAMEEASSQSQLRCDLQEVLEAGQRAKSLTSQLLAFSRRQVLTMEAIDLNDLILSMENMLKRLIGLDIRVTIQATPELPRVWADRSQLEQVLMNLVVNARDAMPEGGELLLATTVAGLEDGEATSGTYVCLEIRDSGCGISAEDLSRIFEPFFTTKGLGKGTGLGLAMVYGIVNQTNGSIEVTSQPGQGTSFRVLLPAYLTDHQPQPPQALAPGLEGGSETLLVVEDEPAILEWIQRTLSAKGYRILCADGGATALEIGQSRGPEIDLVLSDVIMPALNGPELLSQLRPLCPKAGSLLMSGFPDDALADRGISYYLTKPFDAAGLLRAVRSALNARSGDRETR